jgi:TPR repeat protein
MSTRRATGTNAPPRPGNTDAMHHLGTLCAASTPPDLEAARRWYEQAADAGDGGAMHHLGTLCAASTPPDLEAARRWYERAADAGHSEAMYCLGSLSLRSVKSPDLDGARRWYERAADAGHSGAMQALGVLYAHIMESPDLDAARRWYEITADVGRSGAVTALGDPHAQLIQPPDLDAARRWYERGAAAGDRGAMHNLEVLYGDSTDTPVGWGARPPNAEEIDAMDHRVAIAIRAACNKSADPLINQLPAELPTPDPDLTRALQALIDDANEMRWAGRDLSDPLTAKQLETIQCRLGDIASSMHAVRSIYDRHCEILESAGRD